ncbi:tripartite motif-containing protein [Anaeramoeba flamelloides]|uniref:Tripartite motif-containing protein n=1 Tax=Anaeramoeba flamelloides TaxID=1746091 RepID=A0AAV7YEJ8_9EUKA|nr:tripartite motif-containing protein [Anaeramoeba flamelloides]
MTTNHPIQPKEEKSVEEIIWCDVCLEDDRKVEAIVYCHDCEENQCEECDLIHQNRRFKKHRRTDLKPNSDNNRTEKCPIHQNNKLSRYCKNCKKLICNECVFEHTNHETIAFDQPMDFYKELINEQKKFTQNHFERINEKFKRLKNSEKEMKSKKEKIFSEISEFYLNQKKLLDLLEQNEIKLANDFFQQISKSMNKEKQTINDIQYSTETLLKQFNKLESNINQSNSFGFFKLFSQMQLNKTQEKPKSEFPRLCNEHKNKPFQYFCIDHKQLLCVDCLTLNHRKCNQVQNLKNWKLNLPFDPNKTQINLPNEIQLENKLQFSILLKNQFNETINAQEFNPKAEILKSNSNEMITEITKFKEGTNQELIGEYLFQKEGEYQINMSINDQKIPKSPFKLKVIDQIFFLKESEILQKENNPKFLQFLEKWINEAGCNSNLKRRFNSKTDGWKYQTFHEKCDNKGKSIVLIKLKNNSLFGGFAAIDWDSSSDWKQSTGNKSFLFSLISLDPNFKEPLKMPIYQNQDYEIYCYKIMDQHLDVEVI